MARVAFAVACVLVAFGCSAPPPSVSSDRSSAEELGKREALRAFWTSCDLNAERRPLPVQAEGDSPPPPPPGNAAPFEPFVYLDMALLAVPSELLRERAAAGASLVSDRRVQWLGAPQLSAPLGRPSRIELEHHSGPLSRPSVREIHTTVTQLEGEVILTELGFVLQLPHQSAPLRVEPPEARISFAAGLRQQKPVQLHAPIPQVSERSLLVLLRLYVMDEPDDQRALFECHLQRRRRQW